MSVVSMLRIGDLARLGGVSVRMLRHYHEIGLLVPTHVDESTGYRSYDAQQLCALRRIVELKDLGLSLAEVESVFNGDYDVDGLRTLLRARREEATDEAAAARSRIERIDAYLSRLDREDSTTLPATGPIDVEVRAVEERLVAQLTAVAESWAPADISPVIQPLYPELRSRMNAAGVEILGPSTAWYDDTAEGRVAVHATLTIADRPSIDPTPHGFEITQLPALERVASTIHRGTMDNCDTTYQALLEWIERNGYRPLGYSREIDIECGPDCQRITELQIPIEPSAEHQQ
jgi:DNA-binding transcriptional MerR regulator